MKLSIELIPKTTFFTNVRSLVSAPEWDRLRKQCYRNANYKCEICGGVGDRHPVECHEVWDYNYETETQTLLRLIALCPACHEVKHFGLAELRGNGLRATKHLMKVNKIGKTKAQTLIKNAFKDWQKKNTIRWKLDTSILKCTKEIYETYNSRK